MNRVAVAAVGFLLSIGAACPSSTPRDFPLQHSSATAPGFVCGPKRCVQDYPRTPDDSDWSCADMAGAVVCLGGTRAAGVATASANPRWRCGDVANRPLEQRRVCIDVEPDFPVGSASAWRCHFQNELPMRRICDRSSHNPMLGDACSAALPCVDGAVCQAQRCVAPSGNPFCWVDRDCQPNAVCRFGGCLLRRANP